MSLFTSIAKGFLEKANFPVDQVKFAFTLKHIDRYKKYYSNRFKNPYTHDLVLSVNDVKAFHQANFQLNKAHYPISARFFKTRLVTLFQHYGAKIHINYLPMERQEGEEGPQQYLRYMIVEHGDLIRDLQYWETLSVSSLMMRPIKVIHNEDWFNNDSEMQESFHQNRVSGLAFALLTSQSQVQMASPEQDLVALTEKKLYTNVLEMTHYRSKGLRLLDYEDTDIVVGEQFHKFKEIYRPLLSEVEPFKDSVKLVQDMSLQGRLPVSEDEMHVKFSDNLEFERELMFNLNDNVFRNLSHFKISPRTYDPMYKKYTKKILSDTQIEREVDSFLKENSSGEKRDKSLHRSLEKIMIAHRNTKLFFVLMSGPFLALMLFLKYSLKILILYILYKKKAAMGKKESEAIPPQGSNQTASIGIGYCRVVSLWRLHKLSPVKIHHIGNMESCMFRITLASSMRPVCSKFGSSQNLMQTLSYLCILSHQYISQASEMVKEHLPGSNHRIKNIAAHTNLLCSKWCSQTASQ